MSQPFFFGWRGIVFGTGGILAGLAVQVVHDLCDATVGGVHPGRIVHSRHPINVLR